MLRHRAGCVPVVAMALVAACGDSSTTPSSPSPQAPGFPTGRGTLTIFSDGDVCTAKTPAWGSQPPRVAAAVTVSAAGAGWVARPLDTRFGGDAELRFVLTDVSASGARVTGSMRGTAIDLTGVLPVQNPIQVSVSGAAPGEDAVLIGGYSTQAPLVIGGLSGTLVYSDTQRGLTTCTRGNVLLAIVPQ